MTKAEKETIMRWDEGERTVSIYSCSPAVWRRCERKGHRAISVQRDLAGKELSREYLVPLLDFRWGFKSEARSCASKRKAAFVPRGPVIDGAFSP